jgi:hypothetical protein
MNNISENIKYRIAYFLSIILTVFIGFATTLVKEDNFILKKTNGWLLDFSPFIIMVIVSIIHLLFYLKVKNIDRYFS